MKFFNFIRSLFQGKKEVTQPKKAVTSTTATKRKEYLTPSKKTSNKQYQQKTSPSRQQREVNGSNSKVLKGKLKYFNKSKGYGFIESKAMQDRIFVHISDLQTHTKVGSMVEFQLISNDKGYQAKQVKRLRKAQPAKRRVN